MFWTNFDDLTSRVNYYIILRFLALHRFYHLKSSFKFCFLHVKYKRLETRKIEIKVELWKITKNGEFQKNFKQKWSINRRDDIKNEGILVVWRISHWKSLEKIERYAWHWTKGICFHFFCREANPKLNWDMNYQIFKELKNYLNQSRISMNKGPMLFLRSGLKTLPKIKGKFPKML